MDAQYFLTLANQTMWVLALAAAPILLPVLVSGLVISLVLINLASHAVQSNWSFFTIERFHWSTGTIGLSLAVVGALVGGVQAGLTRIVNPKLGNEKSIYIGLLLYAIGMALFAVASQSWMMFVFLIPYCLGGICGPALQSEMASHVPSNQQGELQGSLTGVMSLTTIIGPIVMTNIFAHFTSKTAPVYFPGAPFVVGAVFMLASAIIAYYVLHKRGWKEAEVQAAAPAEAVS